MTAGKMVKIHPKAVYFGQRSEQLGDYTREVGMNNPRGPRGRMCTCIFASSSSSFDLHANVTAAKSVETAVPIIDF